MIRDYQVIVIGGGHAGCEAALAASRLGCVTLLVTMNIDTIAQMSCNPAIGGPAAKSHLVREIDALGGEMAKIIDKSFLNIRMLNLSRGPAVHALRAQADKKKYQSEMTLTLQTQPNLLIKQAIVSELLISGGQVNGIRTKTGTEYTADTIVLAAGTFLKGRLVFGETSYPGGRDGEPSSEQLSASLTKAGIKLARFQTATPPRIHADSIDYTKLIEQPPSNQFLRFSFDTVNVIKEQKSCWFTRTNEQTINVIRDNLHYSPIKSGSVSGKGPRFCPSIDRKVVRSPEKFDHQIVLEPEGRYTKEIYCLGLTTAMPENIQHAILRAIPGLENCEIMRAGYAVEYDYIIPSQVRVSLESKVVKGLFTAGQVNGTSGYEEAAAQGLMAGINAARVVLGEDSIVIRRSQGYIGVLIDDLVIKGTDEPYRMMTSRAEYRLLLRQDNADLRLRKLGYKIGIIDKKRYGSVVKKQDKIRETLDWLKGIQVSPSAQNREILLELKSGDLKKAVSLHAILQRPEIRFSDLARFTKLSELSDEVIKQVEIECKFSGYIERQNKQVSEFHKFEDVIIPKEIDYKNISGLRIEARERLSQIRPVSLGQAARISGVSPADISVLSVVLKGAKPDVSA